MAKKRQDAYLKITLTCTECKERSYTTKGNCRNDPDRVELRKYCPRCHIHRTYHETR